MKRPVPGVSETVSSRRGFWRDLGATVRAVAWSFLGVRRQGARHDDARRLNPVVVILTGILCTALFVVGLMAFVRWMIRHAV